MILRHVVCIWGTSAHPQIKIRGWAFLWSQVAGSALLPSPSTPGVPRPLTPGAPSSAMGACEPREGSDTGRKKEQIEGKTRLLLGLQHAWACHRAPSPAPLSPPCPGTGMFLHLSIRYAVKELSVGKQPCVVAPSAKGQRITLSELQLHQRSDDKPKHPGLTVRHPTTSLPPAYGKQDGRTVVE